MIRFVPLTAHYWPDGDGAPCCAFLSTTTDTFVTLWDDKSHVFDSMDEVRRALGERGVSLVPPGFFDAQPQRHGPTCSCGVCVDKG